jgi:hypothetical protein
MNRIGIALRDHLDRSIRFIADVSRDVFAPGGVFDKYAKADTLHTARDEVTARDKHGRLYKEEKTKGAGKAGALQQFTNSPVLQFTSQLWFPSGFATAARPL